jgi:hypothetical protein
MNTQQPSPSLRRWFRYALMTALLSGAFLTSQACEPFPSTLQFGKVSLHCDQGSGGGGNNQSQASNLAAFIDVSYRDPDGTLRRVTPQLNLDISLIPQITTNSDGSKLMPETNYIILQKLTYFYEYPQGFSLGQDAFLAPPNQPRVMDIYARINPSFTALFNQPGGGAGAAIPITENDQNRVISNFMPPDLGNALRGASELSNPEGLTITLNVSFEGKTGWGSVIKTGNLRFTVTLCDGCRGCQLAEGESISQCFSTGLGCSDGKE